MTVMNAPVDAVLQTLARATVDASVPVVLAGGTAQEVAQLSRWLARVHGTPRTVVGSLAHARALIVVRLTRETLAAVVERPDISPPPSRERCAGAQF